MGGINYEALSALSVCSFSAVQFILVEVHQKILPLPRTLMAVVQRENGNCLCIECFPRRRCFTVVYQDDLSELFPPPYVCQCVWCCLLSLSPAPRRV